MMNLGPQTLRGVLPALLEEARTNRRALLGLAAAGLLSLALIASRLEQTVDDLNRTYAGQMQLLQRLEGIEGGPRWAARAEASGRLRQSFESRLWAAESEGVATAHLSDWVTEAGHRAGLTDLQVKVETTTPKGLPPDRLQLSATITAIQTEPALIAFLERIESDPRLLVVDRLHVRRQPLPRLDMTLVTQVRLGPAGTAAR